ncbi:S-adenosyl-L-methionine-dependent methyltransferase [Xylariaceae sp. FL0594]|nr:S-adenosyl-L-methionine-dependent methyltransferase [Xylariaceae sp. FL0594]
MSTDSTEEKALVPKQITEYQIEHLAELQGDVSEQATKYFLGLIPPINAGDVIHDNACGHGAVTAAIMASNPPTGIHIHATDINEEFVKGVKGLVKSNGWPVTTAVMPAQKLTFKDNMFTKSITSFAFHCIGDRDKAARQIYRTLKPGGYAIASIWVFMPHVKALQHAHWETRGEDAPLPTLLEEDECQESHLRDALKAGGFTDEDISCSETTAHLKVPQGGLKRWAQLAWSYLGQPPSGWSQADEEHWDRALDDIEKQLQSGDGITTGPNGETVMEMRAVVAVAKK